LADVDSCLNNNRRGGASAAFGRQTAARWQILLLIIAAFAAERTMRRMNLYNIKKQNGTSAAALAL